MENESLPRPNEEGYHGYSEEELERIVQIPPEDNRAWMQYAAGCVEEPDLFFAVGKAQNEAARFCRKDCPVVQQCGAWALGTGEEFGVLGGMTERQRRAMLKENPSLRWKA